MDAVDKGHYVGALLQDFIKAFDSVPHQLLLTELQAIGCITDTITWFCNYLTDREQRVITHEQITEWMVVSRGFPQGSGLSPLLFNIFIRRLPRHCISTTLQFADDTMLAAADSSLSVVADNLTASFSCVKTFVKLTNWLSILPRPNLLFSNQWAEEYQTNFIFSRITVPLHHKRQLSYSVLLLISTLLLHHILKMSSPNVMDFSEHWLEPLCISRGSYSNFHTQLSSDLIWNIVVRYLLLQSRLTSRNLTLFNV